MRKYICTLLALMALTACKKDETLRYNNMTMGNIHGEQIISDQGNTFNITESLFDVNLDSFPNGRVMVLCDVLKETSEKTYDIRLTGISNVLVKDVKTMADSTPEEDLTADDPLILREIWYSGGYLNMNIEIAIKHGSESVHYINLLRNENDQKEGEYTFILRHNALGEVPSADDREYSSSTGVERPKIETETLTLAFSVSTSSIKPTKDANGPSQTLTCSPISKLTTSRGRSTPSCI